MAKKPTKSGSERIIPPSKAVLSKASADMKKGDRAGARAMSDAGVAAKQGVKRPPGKK